MLDIRYIRENADRVQESAKNKGYDISIASLLETDKRRRELQQQVDELRTQRNEIASQMKGGKPAPELVEKGRSLKGKLAELESELHDVDVDFQAQMGAVPNVTREGVPRGGEEDSVEVKAWGDKRQSAEDHLEFATQRGWLDFERGAKVAGTKFYYIKGDLMLLENAIYQYALNLLISKGFTPMTVPHMVSGRVARGSGFAPKSDKESNEYFIDGADGDFFDFCGNSTLNLPVKGE